MLTITICVFSIVLSAFAVYRSFVVSAETKKRNASLLSYVDRIVKNCEDAVSLLNKECSGYENRLEEVEKKICDLENGIVPDYSAALKAKESMDETANAMASIFGYDQKAALKKKKEDDG